VADVRASVHTAEINLRDGDVGGIGVHIGTRVWRPPPWMKSWFRGRFAI
jgi:hypothetical protein